MTAGLVEADLSGITGETAQTTGEMLYAAFGITGIRGQAEAGFPAVENVGLPILRQALEKGLAFNDALCITLLHLLPVTEDTNFIHRSNLKKWNDTQKEISDFLQADPFPSLEAILELDRRFIAENLSPGGTADLLAVTCFLYLLGG